MNPEYLKRAVGNVLSDAIRATAEADPSDPILFLARWLLHYRDHQDGCAEFTKSFANIQSEKEEYLAKLAVEMARLEEERKQREEEARRIAEEQRLAKEAALKKRQAEEEDENESEAESKGGGSGKDESGSGYSGYTD